MGKERQKRRQFTIQYKQHKHEKISQLKKRYALASSPAEKRCILEKAMLVNVYLNSKDFVK